MRGHLVFGDPRPQEFHRFPVRGVADGADDAEALLLVDVLDGARLHHRRHAVDPIDPAFLKAWIMLMSMKSTPSFIPATPLFFISLTRALVNFLTCCREAGPAAP